MKQFQINPIHCILGHDWSILFSQTNKQSLKVKGYHI